MKTALLIIMVLFAIKSFAAQEGEIQATPCPMANQEASRDAKVVLEESGTQVTEEATTAKK
jgi:hypothetical protein